MTISTVGNVGIGSTSPNYLLSMESDSTGGFYNASTNAFTTGPSFSWLKQDREVLTKEEALEILTSTNIEKFKFIEQVEQDGEKADTHIGIVLDEAHPLLSEHENGTIVGYNPIRAASVAFRGVQMLIDVFDIQNAPTTTPSLVIDASGNFGIATTTPTNILTIGQGMGNAIADGWSVYSSEKYKTDITYLEERDYEDILKEIEGMNLATYRWKGEAGVDSSPLAQNDNDASPQNDIGLGKMLGVIAEQAPAQVLSPDGQSVSLYDYASYALAGVKAVKSEVDKLKEILGVVENEDGTLGMADSSPIDSLPTAQNDIITLRSADGQEYQLALDSEGYVVLDKIRVRDLEIISGGQLTVASGANEITGGGEIVMGQRYGEVKNSKVAADSKIFVSFTSNLGGNNWWVCEKEAGEYFRVCISSPAETLTTFDYWIVQTKETISTTTESVVIISEPAEETATSTEPVIGTSTPETMPVAETGSVETATTTPETSVSTSTAAVVQ